MNQDSGNGNSKIVTDVKERGVKLIIFEEGEVTTLMFRVRATDSDHLLCNRGQLML